jgi:hypothetical protein
MKVFAYPYGNPSKAEVEKSKTKRENSDFGLRVSDFALHSGFAFFRYLAISPALIAAGAATVRSACSAGSIAAAVSGGTSTWLHKTKAQKPMCSYLRDTTLASLSCSQRRSSPTLRIALVPTAKWRMTSITTSVTCASESSLAWIMQQSDLSNCITTTLKKFVDTSSRKISGLLTKSRESDKKVSNGRTD